MNENVNMRFDYYVYRKWVILCLIQGEILNEIYKFVVYMLKLYYF